MKYLITGGCGFVGSNLAVEVLKRNEELRLSRNFPPATILGIMAMGEGYAKVSNL